MKSRVKTALSLLTSAVFIILAGCSNADSMMKVPGRYLLNGTLSEYTDANNFAYYINDDEAYVARGSSTSTTPEVPATVTLNGITYDVTGVYHGGFANSNITSITLPLSITTIDYQAFAGSSLTSAVIPCNVEEMGSGAYMNCHSLTAVQFKNDESAGSSNLGVCGAGGSNGSGEATGTSHLEEIPDYCFFNDENLTTLSLPRSLTSVNTCAFQACTSLEKVAFLSGFTTLKKYAFESCTSLTDVYFPNSFTTASNNTSNCDPHAFYRVNSSCTIHISSTTEAAYNVWSAATSWRSCNDAGTALALAARTTSDIGLGSDYLYRVENGEATVFSYAPSSFPASGVVVMPNEIDGYKVGKAETTTYSAYLTSVTQMYLSKNLKSLENNFFNGMSALTTISTTSDGCYTPADNIIDLSGMTRLETAGQWLFTNSGGGNKATYMCGTFAGRVVLPKALKTIGEGAFANLAKASEISISATTPNESLLESIGEKAFTNFGSNKASSWGDTSAFAFFDLTLPATCTSIGSNAFGMCFGLRKIEFLGASGKSLNISSNAFYRCRSLCEVVFPKEDDNVTIGTKAFYECSAGNGFGFLGIQGIQEVYFPSNVTSIGDRAFGCNERACFYFEAASKPNGVNKAFNFVSSERLDDSKLTEEGLNSGRDAGATIGYIEYAPVYYGVGYLDGSTSAKRRYLRTDNFGFVETGVGTGKFICSRYRFQPNNLSSSAKVTVTVPEYIKYKANHTDVYEGEEGASTDFQVVSLGDSAFSACYTRSANGNKKLVGVNVPHSIKRIGDNCFARSIFFNKLSSYKNGVTNDYYFPESLKYIGRTAFVLTRLYKALNIPGDVVTFDMIDPSETAAGRNPVDFSAIDNSTPRTLTSSEWEPRRYGCIFANDWYLSEVTFTSGANFYVDTNAKAIYRLKQIGNGGTFTNDVQLLMVMARLTSYNLDSTTKEYSDGFVDAQNIVMGDTGYEFRSDMSSIHYGAFKIATWLKGLILDTSKDVFAKKWNSDPNANPIPLDQALFEGLVDFPTYGQIGGKANDTYYWINCQSLSFISSNGNFALAADVARCCTRLGSMTFPKNLTTIPSRAFDQDSGVSSWITPNASDVLTVGGQEGGTGVLDLRNNDALTSIGRSAFYGNTIMTKVFTPSNLNDLGIYVWQNNTSLSYVDMSASTSLTTISNSCFMGDPIATMIWPSGTALKTIDKNAFSGNKIENLIVPNSVTTIVDGAFQNGTATKILCLPTSLSSIAQNSFTNNPQLNQVYVGNARTGLADNTVDMKKGTFGPNVKYAIMPNSAKFNSMPFQTCTDLKAVFYGRKYADTTSETIKNLAKYSGGTKDAPLYYYTESSSDMHNQAGPLYWRYKPGSTTTVQVMEYPNYTVSAEYDFSTLLS